MLVFLFKKKRKDRGFFLPEQPRVLIIQHKCQSRFQAPAGVDDDGSDATKITLLSERI